MPVVTDSLPAPQIELHTLLCFWPWRLLVHCEGATRPAPQKPTHWHVIDDIHGLTFISSFEHACSTVCLKMKPKIFFNSVVMAVDWIPSELSPAHNIVCLERR